MQQPESSARRSGPVGGAFGCADRIANRPPVCSAKLASRFFSMPQPLVLFEQGVAFRQDALRISLVWPMLLHSVSATQAPPKPVLTTPGKRSQ